jgi:hypothetical protein
VLLNDYDLPLPGEDTPANKIFHNRPSDIHELSGKKIGKKKEGKVAGETTPGMLTYN